MLYSNCKFRRWNKFKNTSGKVLFRPIGIQDLEFFYIKGLTLTQHILTHDQLKDFKATVECEAPNKDLYKFSGNINTNDGKWV